MASIMVRVEDSSKVEKIAAEIINVLEKHGGGSLRYDKDLIAATKPKRTRSPKPN